MCFVIRVAFTCRSCICFDLLVVDVHRIKRCVFFSLSPKMHVLEYHATMAHVSMKVHRIDVNVNEVMKVQCVIDQSIHAQALFVIMEVSVMYKKIINQSANVHLVIEDRTAMKQMVRFAGNNSHENEKKFFAC